MKTWWLMQESRDAAAVAFVLWLCLLVAVGSLTILQILPSLVI